jgi:hypothetical protein
LFTTQSPVPADFTAPFEAEGIVDGKALAATIRRARIPETVIMKIAGWRTRSVFERDAIVSRGENG